MVESIKHFCLHDMLHLEVCGKKVSFEVLIVTIMVLMKADVFSFGYVVDFVLCHS